MWIRSTKAFNTHLNRFYLWKPCFKPRHACAVKPEVLICWSLEIDYSRAPCLGADQKTRGLWERDWERAVSGTRDHITGALIRYSRPEYLHAECRCQLQDRCHPCSSQWSSLPKLPNSENNHFTPESTKDSLLGIEY